MENITNNTLTIYHGGDEFITNPEIRIGKYTKDFYWGFYFTILPEQAERLALRNIRKSVVSVYNCTISAQLNVKQFEKMSDEWLDFIVMCRNGGSHGYDLVEGPMADDTIYNYVQDFVEGKISRNAFWELARFRYPTHQISFHTARALACLTYERSYNLR
ncbi:MULTISPECIES: DUF3990 domain-containing protein [Clostridium]|uniref:DUF3990 domain-containing protein n=1 Tax=Clostridium frigoriphilum TaxID=443253 RepID=A0ABU7USK3_9CLOT|nr:DUF3990 domain-containing protein [Clostridium sp. DSM 17811]MBU3101517.1 DUF3990 domain-containing protein [Clostridium sp. DSM 17811]